MRSTRWPWSPLTWLQARVPAEWVDRYGHRLDSARLPSGKEARRAWACQVGADGYRLLDAVYASDAPPALRTVEAVEVLRRIWVQQFTREEGQVGWRAETNLLPAAQRINSPYGAGLQIAQAFDQFAARGGGCTTSDRGRDSVRRRRSCAARAANSGA